MKTALNVFNMVKIKLFTTSGMLWGSWDSFFQVLIKHTIETNPFLWKLSEY